jgi:hypothetical protein
MVLDKDCDGFMVTSRYTLNILMIIGYGKRMQMIAQCLF